MKKHQIKQVDKEAMTKKILELKKELVKMNGQVAIGTSLKNPGQVRKVKKTLARILTINNEKIQKNKTHDTKEGEEKV